jgi:hypothetical protein
MKKSLCLLFTSLALQAAATNINTQHIQGHWTMAGSPYVIQNDVTVDSATSLTIDPGVDIQFAGYYKFEIFGYIHAAGTAAQPINFHAQDTTGWSVDGTVNGGWSGVHYMYNLGPVLDSSDFEYCNIKDVKDGPSFYLFNEAFVAMRKITFNHCSISHCQSFNTTGDGIILWLDNVGGSEIGNCSIHDNQSTFQVLWSDNGSGYTHIHDNAIYNNASRQIVLMVGSQLFDHNDVYGNSSNTSGAAIVVEGGHVTILKNKIHNNNSIQEGAISADAGIVDIDGNLVCNNISTAASCGVSDGGGGMHLISNPNIVNDTTSYTVRNNVIANNYTAFYGGGIYIWSTQAKIMNNTIINNHATLGAPGIYVVDTNSKVYVKNNLFYNNENQNADQLPTIDANNDLQILSAKEYEFDYNWTAHQAAHNVYITPSIFTITRVGDSTHNTVGTDPLLTAPTLTPAYTESALTADFSLKSTSPCINIGDTASAYPTTLDYGDNPRISGSKIDAGAYEYQEAQGVAVAQALTNNMSLYPNPSVGNVIVSLPEASGIITVEDLTGHLLMQQKVNGLQTQLNAGLLPKGFYMVKWQSNGQQAVQKLIMK